MGRPLRKWRPGQFHHVAGELAGRSKLLSRPWAVRLLLDELHGAREESGLEILAWCVLPDSYEMVARLKEVPPWRVVARIHSRFSRKVNRRRGSRGSVWACRYRSAALRENELVDAVAYVHLLPVYRGLVERARAHPWSGYHELLDAPTSKGLLAPVSRGPFANVLLEAAERAEGMPNRYFQRRRDLPWWARTKEDHAESTGRYSRFFSRHAAQYLETAHNTLGIVRSARSRHQCARRDIILWFGTVRLGIPNRILASLVGLHPGSISRAVFRAEQRLFEAERTEGEHEALLRKLELAVLARWPGPASIRLCQRESWHRGMKVVETSGVLQDADHGSARGTPRGRYPPGSMEGSHPRVFVDPTPVDPGDFEGL